MADKKKIKRPPMKQVQHPVHNVPPSDYDGDELSSTQPMPQPMAQQGMQG